MKEGMTGLCPFLTHCTPLPGPLELENSLAKSRSNHVRKQMHMCSSAELLNITNLEIFIKCQVCCHSLRSPERRKVLPFNFCNQSRSFYVESIIRYLGMVFVRLAQFRVSCPYIPYIDLPVVKFNKIDILLNFTASLDYVFLFRCQKFG